MFAAAGLFGVSLALALAAQPAQSTALPAVDTSVLPAEAAAAIEDARGAASARPGDPARIGRFGMVLHAWEQWDAALQAYALAERLAPADHRWPHLAGLLETRRGRHPEAVAHFARAAARAPGDATVRLRLAEAHLEAGDVGVSEPLFVELAHSPATRAAAEYGLGRVALARGHAETALQHFDAAVAAYADFGAAHYGRAMALRRLGRDSEAAEAIRRQQACLACWPATGDQVADSLASIREDAGALLQRGIALARERQDTRAIELHERALTLDPQLAQARVNLITLYGRTDGLDRAETAYDEAVRQGAHVAEAHANYGQVLLAAGRPADAARVLRLATAASPADAQAWNALGLALEMTGDPQAASDAYREAVVHAPALRVARFNLARTLVARGRLDEAVAELERIQTPEDEETPRYRFALAAALVRTGQIERGRRRAREALDLARRYHQPELAATIERDLAMLKE